MSEIGEVLAGVAIGYLIGTFPSADLVTRIASRGSVHIRDEGSGNPGGLNSMRVLGRRWGVLVIVLDAAKGALAGFLGLLIGDAAAYSAATASIAGHVWPVWSRFSRRPWGCERGWIVAPTVFPPFFVIGAVIGGTTALVTRNAGFTVRLLCPVWVAAAALWWATDLPNWWGPDAGAGLFVYALIGAAIVFSRFLPSVRSGSEPL